jgi:hypothetical protein
MLLGFADEAGWAKSPKILLQRFLPLLHYPNKWNTSPDQAMGHSLGAQTWKLPVGLQ